MDRTIEGGARIRKFIVYTGPGSSNSWIWLADFLEKQRFLTSIFAPEVEDIISASDDSILIIPGGDTFRIARAFGESGLCQLSKKISNGMGYVGICAGAYLPLRSSIPPLSSFNIMSAKISNISSSLPNGIAEPDKYSVRYGCLYVFHPVRGPVKLTGDAELVAPIYGGPFLSSSGGERVRLTFSGTTADTELLVGIETYNGISEGKAACIEQGFGEGRVLAIAPHLEHPDYPEANGYLRGLLLGFRTGRATEEGPVEDMAELKELRSTLADLRVLASALESNSWKIGVKYWESEKLLFYIDAIRKRVPRAGGDHPATPEVLARLQVASRDLKALHERYEERVLQSIVDNLSRAASIYLTAHFARSRGS